jgi:uncharacterized protein (TIGR04141 family)
MIRRNGQVANNRQRKAFRVFHAEVETVWYFQSLHNEFKAIDACAEPQAAPTSMASEKTNLTMFLLKADQLANLKKAFSNHVFHSLIAPLTGFYIPLPSKRLPPQWLPAVSSIVVTGTALQQFGESPAGLLVIERPTKTFVVTFGHGWQKLEDDWIERDFGRRVALNAIPREQLLEIRAEQVFAKWHVANERAPRAAAVEEFGVEFDRDLVAAVEGVPSKSLQPVLGKSVRGGTSFKASIPFSGLEDILDKSGDLFDSDAYRKIWPEIDNIMPVKDESLIAQLEGQFDAELSSGKAQKKVVMFIPSRRDEGTSSMESYVFGRMSKSPAMTPYLTVNSWLSYLEQEDLKPTVDEAKRTRIHLIDELKDEFQSHTAFDCFGYELSFNGHPYILSSGIWYEVVAKFLKKTNDIANGILVPKTNLVHWNPGEDEGEYNARCAAAKGFLFFDAKNISYGGGHSKFEFCDFVDLKTKTLFFAKNATRSSGMSHLVEQVRRTAELLFSTDGEFRSKLIDVFKKVHPGVDTSWLKSRPPNNEWKLCLVSLGKNALQLPFFARCGLVRAYNDLTRRGHVVFFTAV